MSNLLNIKDQSGNWIPIPVVTNGIKSITQNEDYTLTITLNDGTTYTTTSIKGEDGQDYILTEQDKQDIAGLVDTPVDDVQINGTSIVENGVVNVPMASTSVPGVIQIDGQNATGVQILNGKLQVLPASISDIKGSWGKYRTLSPMYQDYSTFYGLAKAAGADEKNSTLPVGEYSEEAKIAIQKMLGIYEAPWELIREDTFTNAEEADHIIDVDANGEPFELTDVILLFETSKQATVSSKGQYGDITFYANGTALTQAECGAWTQNANDPAHGVTVMIEQEGNMLITTVASQATNSNNGTVRWRYGATFDNTVQSVRYLQTRVAITSINIIKVLGTGHYKLYGKRKWQ